MAAKSLILVLLLLGTFAYLMLFERKILGFFQFRLGPNRTGPWGLLQPVADGVKALIKEDVIPAEADRLIYLLAPGISLFMALAAYAVIPVGPPVHIGRYTVPLSIADPGAGILVLLAFTSLGIYGVALGGWASQSKYALLGGLRASAQLISYEIAMAMNLLAVLVMAGSLRLSDIVAAQSPYPYALVQPLGFVIYLITASAEVARAPFDLPEAETELVAGYHTEYSGLRMAMFVMAEYVNLITQASLVTLLYLGGWAGPSWLPGVVWFLLKLGAVLFFFIWVRATVPRLRYDQLMALGWKVLLPLSVANLLAYAGWAALAG
ncbi:NADH-quinone oxidoreductase subunit NuoH [Carboxydochorda subterranea]|uniref:NADH-quinone oxidoreductase subunit H n=1 Tax=Carboxydichorda subterranea TaxID=3109565 RepID=A0ABZ1C089_9FIRM|nr:NADH-quinone oxidoreductase subunit NuoH [Limnochorda sp. L945t]WRP18196.1 NADH-quinone oxidoreductase subunit NuoH [Limnochorda sp. L945t]